MPERLRQTLARLLAVAASLRLTIGCLGLAMLLVLAGTLAQVTEGLYLAQDRFFRSFFVWTDIAGISLPVLPGGHLLGAVLVVNLLAAHSTRFRWSWSKLGIHLIHLGLLLLILGQFAADLLSTESRMTLDIGQTRHWSEMSRQTELVFLGENKTISIPADALRPGHRLQPERLPFDLQVTDWQPNATLVPRQDVAGHDLHGAARQFTVQPQPREIRLDRRDLPAVTFDLQDRATGESLGQWLAPLQLNQTQALPGGLWRFQLRPRRIEHPFHLTLEKFVHEKYPGTDIPHRFASHLLLEDASGDTRPVEISMNRPLRIAGRTIYQASFANDDHTSILQIVQNPGWITPYVACTLIILGLLVQFGHHLIKTLRAPRPPAAAAATPAPTRWRSGNWVLLPLLFALAALLATAWLRSSSPHGRLAALPVQAHGRIQPLDTLARNTLLLLSGKSTIADPDGHRLSAFDWLVCLVAEPQKADVLPTFRIVHPQVLSLLQQNPDRPARVSFDQLRPHLDAVRDQARAAAELPEKDAYRRAILHLDNALHSYAALRLSFRAATGMDSLAAELAVYAPLVPHALDQAKAWRSGDAFHRQELTRFVTLARAYRAADPLALAQPAWPRPPITTTWTSLPGALLASATARSLHPAVGLYAAALGHPTAPRQTQPLVEAVQAAQPDAAARAASESLFHTLDLFSLSRFLYLGAFLCGVLSWLAAPAALRQIALRFAQVAFALTTIGLVWRMTLLDRPPVTNLSSSALFVAWVAVGVGLFIERLTRDGLAVVAASALGCVSLLIADRLAAEADSMGVLIAVLDNNFWLATHVIAITIGYAATFLAGFLGLTFLFLRTRSAQFDPPAQKRLAGMIYGVLCFALLFSFTGTILGGIWADQSWGRFWGWDPKENGALLIVLWNALILHARWGGFLRARGLAVLAVLGNVVTAFSWFGTNLLGIGLHSYGFTESGFLWLSGFALSQILLVLLARLPARTTSAARR